MVELNRSLLLIATDLALARQESEAAQEGLALGGMAEFYDSAITRVYYIKKGEYEAALRVSEEDIERETLNFNNEIIAIGYQIWIYAILGRFTEAEETYTKTQRRFPQAFLSSSLRRQRLSCEVGRVTRNRHSICCSLLSKPFAKQGSLHRTTALIGMQVAREIGAMTPSIEQEATALLKTKGLVLPAIMSG